MDNDNLRVAQILGYAPKPEEVEIEETKIEIVDETKEVVDTKPEVKVTKKKNGK